MPLCRRPVDRRWFLKALGSVAVSTALGPVLLDAFGSEAAARVLRLGALDETLPVGTPICVLVTLDGGNDSLNTLVPVNDPWYYDPVYGHGALALGPAVTLGLTGTGYRLHGALTWLADRWNTVGDVAFVQGVGENVVHNFSHFDATKYWQTADLSLLEPRGWMGRYNDLVRPGSPLASISLSERRLETVGQSGPVLVVTDTSLFSYAVHWYGAASFRAGLDLMATVPAEGVRGQAARLIATTFAASERVRGATDPTITAGEHPRITQNLLQAALLIRAGIPCQTYATAFGPFDSHSDQPTMQRDRLTELNDALQHFFAALETSERRNDVFVMIVSEFGRQVTGNASDGTDHGQAGLAVLVGAGVRGGLYGEAPTLDPGGPSRPNRVHDALRPTLDFRSLHAMALTRLGRDAGLTRAVLGADYEDLHVFATAPPQPPPPPKARNRGGPGPPGSSNRNQTPASGTPPGPRR